MNKQMYDSLTMNERLLCEEYFAHKEPRRRPLLDLGCPACEDEQMRTNNNTSLCKSCQRDMESYYGRK